MEDETDSILAKIYELNSDKSINAIMLLMPLRKELDEARIFGAIAKEKDVDSISGYSISEIVGQGIYSTGFLPCTAEAVIRLIKFYSVEISGKSVVVVGRSRVIGLPVSLLFLNENATVTICHSRTENIRDITMQADIVIAAAGQKKMVDVSYIKRGAILIDVGIHTDVSGLTGDVDADSVEGVAGALSPVPGGLGSVTTAILSEHVLRAAES
jgi:methylenetetrahydrofolate dehydrogenase (NADP+)/methenyltetrahydrofolate cyclohydrolase